MYYNLMIHSLVVGHLGCFQSLAIVNCAVMKILYYLGHGISSIFKVIFITLELSSLIL
jgi:hypothetical protein